MMDHHLTVSCVITRFVLITEMISSSTVSFAPYACNVSFMCTLSRKLLNYLDQNNLRATFFVVLSCFRVMYLLKKHLTIIRLYRLALV
jgi:hypothetical protein